MCCPNLEAIFINCKPFYLPGEFSSFILVSVFIPTDARVSVALELLVDQITHTEQRYPDSLIMILCDFNKATLTRELPKYRQHITFRDSNIGPLLHCFKWCLPLCPLCSTGTLWSLFGSSSTSLQAET